MDLVSLSIILGAVIAGAAGIQHFYDRYAKQGLYSRTLRTSHDGLDALRSELQALRATMTPGEASEDPLGLEALKSNFMDLPNKIREAVTAGMIEAPKNAAKDPSLMADEDPVGMDAVHAMGGDDGGGEEAPTTL